MLLNKEQMIDDLINAELEEMLDFREKLNALIEEVEQCKIDGSCHYCVDQPFV